MAMAMATLRDGSDAHNSAWHNGGSPIVAGTAVTDLRDEPSQPSLFTDGGDRSAAGQWFDLDQTACFLLAPDGQVLDMNVAAERVLYQERFVAIVRDRLTLGCERNDVVLERALEAICGHAPMRRRDFVRGADLEWRAMDTVGVPGHTAAFITFRPSAPLRERLSALAGAFSLTPTESSVLCALVLGRAPKDIGRDHGICTATVRTHLRSIFTKLEVRGISGTLAFIISIT